MPSPSSTRATTALLWLGAVAVVLAAVPYRQFDLDRFLVPKELVLHAVALVGAFLCVAGARRLTPAPIDLLLGLYVGLSAVSVGFAANWWLGARAFGVTFSGALVFWVARALARAGRSRAVLGAVAAAAVVGAATSLAQAYGVDSDYFSINRAPGGTFGNRNFVAHVAAIALPVVILCALEARRGLGFLLWAAGGTALAAVLVLSRSRGAWLAAAVSLGAAALAGLLARRRWLDATRGRRLVSLGGIAAAGVTAALALPNALEWRSDSPYLDSARDLVNYREGSGRGRLVQYQNTLRMAVAHPLLGVGPGNWSAAYPKYASRNDPSLDRDDGLTANPWPSSDWAAFLAERGLPATALLVLTMLALGGGAVRGWLGADDPGEVLAALALGATLLAAVVVGAFDAVLLLPAPALLTWATLGALAPLPAARRGIALGPDGRGWVAAALVLVGGLLVLRSATQIGAMAYANDATGSARMERAARLDPGSYRVRIRLARLYRDRGNCAKARPHALASRNLLPNAPEPRRILSQCGYRERGR
ncbi:MAG TPA: O-antigen ligase family protein [Gemmatimonadaceae bacterium]|nr:O-antigen ligase family protein [Gemmatimonadaceae bacterium]